MIELGSKVNDKITGFKGTLMARATYVYGCVWLLVEADKLHDGKPVECWFDEPRIEEMRKRESVERSEAPMPRLGTFGPPHGGPSRSTPNSRESG